MAGIDGVARNILSQLYSEPNTAGTRQPSGQTINNYLINPIKERQDNQFDFKFDHNLTTEQPLLHPLQLPEDAPAAAGDAASR